MTRVVNLRREAHDVYIGRPGRGESGYFGNPFSVRVYGPKLALALFASYFVHRVTIDEEFRRRVEELRGKALGCFCKPGPCHGDIIETWLRLEPADREFEVLRRYSPDFAQGIIILRGSEQARAGL